MKNNRAFTLIELLVVVLIIGILAAVALPQYRKAVIRSRYATLKNLTQAISQAQEVYYLANNQYATEFDQLDIAMPSGQEDSSTASQYKYTWGNCKLVGQQVICQNSSIHMQYQQYLTHADAPNYRLCITFAETKNDIKNQVCKSETNDTGNQHPDGYWVWIYRKN